MNSNISNEIWKDIEGFEGEYQVSNFGKVRSLDREIIKPNRYGNLQTFKFKGKELRFNDNGKGYLSVQLGRGNRRYVHRLVAEAFLENEYDLPEINHIDNNTKNNSHENLQWVTRIDNIQYKINQGRHCKGESSHLSKLTEEQVREIRMLLSQGNTQVEVGELFGVKQTAVSKISRGESWKHII